MKNISAYKPVVTIITACFNSEEYIEETILSVINQTYTNIEYIIIDGKSMDSTLDIIKKYEEYISKLISESDDGVYDAMNKGIKNSTGDIIYFLNSGDHLFNKKTVENVVKQFTDKSALAVYGNVQIINEKGKRKNIRGCSVTLNSLLYRRICHQTLFVSKKLFNDIGVFSSKYRLSADHEFIVKAIKKYPNRFLYLDEILAEYMDGGMSCKMMTKTKIEDLNIISSNYNIPQYIFGAIICSLVILKYRIKNLLPQIITDYIK
ncbi:MAG: glycosyltransferase family 2 protein [Methanolobus sp.]|nr:glycosyltransferase family 2 protein [Methanolobus sp.]